MFLRGSSNSKEPPKECNMEPCKGLNRELMNTGFLKGF